MLQTLTVATSLAVASTLLTLMDWALTARLHKIIAVAKSIFFIVSNVFGFNQVTYGIRCFLVYVSVAGLMYITRTSLLIFSHISKSIPVQIQKSPFFLPFPTKQPITQSQNNPLIIPLQRLIYEYNF